MVVSDVQLWVRFMVKVTALNTLKCTWEREALPSSAFFSHSTNFFICSRKTLLPLAKCPSVYHFRMASSLRTSARQHNSHTSIIFSQIRYLQHTHGYTTLSSPLNRQQTKTCKFTAHTHLCRAAPRSSGRPSWSGCCHSSTPGSSGAESARTGPVSWRLSAAGCIAATSTRRRDSQSLKGWLL